MSNDSLGAEQKQKQAFIALFVEGQRICFQANVNSKPVFHTFPFNGKISSNLQFFVLQPFKPESTSREGSQIEYRQGFTVEMDLCSLALQREWFRSILGRATVENFSGNKSVHHHCVTTTPMTPGQNSQITLSLKKAFPFADWNVIGDAVRLCRTPGTLRDNGKVQEIEYIGERMEIEKLTSTLERATAGITSSPDIANNFIKALSLEKLRTPEEMLNGKSEKDKGGKEKKSPGLRDALQNMIECGYRLAPGDFEIRALEENPIIAKVLAGEIKAARTRMAETQKAELAEAEKRETDYFTKSKVPSAGTGHSWRKETRNAMIGKALEFYQDQGHIERITKKGEQYRGYEPGPHKHKGGFVFLDDGRYFNHYNGHGGWYLDFIMEIKPGTTKDQAWLNLAQWAGVKTVDRCKYCAKVIEWQEKRPYNPDGAEHKCREKGRTGKPQKTFEVGQKDIGEVIKEYKNFIVTTLGVFSLQVQDSIVTYLRICPDPVRVKDRVKIAEEEESAYVALAWGNEETIVPLSYLQSKNADKLADRGIRILSGNEAKLMTQYFSEALREEIPCRTVYKQLGWHSQQFVIPGMVEDGAILPEAKLSYRVHPAKPGEVEKATDALHSLVEVEENKAFLVLLLHALIAPAAKLLDIERFKFVLFPVGGTGNYKTTLCNYALALYGKDFLMNIIRFGEGATEAGLIKTASVARDIPMLIDNYKPNVGGGEPQLVRVINSIVEGTEKIRLDQRGNFRPSPKLGAWPIVNGETSIESDTAAIARCIEIDFKKGPEAVKNLQAANKNIDYLPGLGEAWIRWLSSKEGKVNIEEVKSRWDEIYQAWHTVATNAGVHNAERVAANFCCINIAYALVCQSTLFGWLKEYQQVLDNLLRKSLGRMAKTTKEAREGVRFLEALRELIGSGQVILGKTKLTSGKPEDDIPDTTCSKAFIGWDDEKAGKVYLLPQIALREARKLNDIRITKNALYQQLDEMGAIAEKDKAQIAVVKRFAKRIERVLAIHRTSLTGEQVNIG